MIDVKPGVHYIAFWFGEHKERGRYWFAVLFRAPGEGPTLRYCLAYSGLSSAKGWYTAMFSLGTPDEAALATVDGLRQDLEDEGYQSSCYPVNGDGQRFTELLAEQPFAPLIEKRTN